ncbi:MULTISPECIES: GDSL-type esterase/lipase family protein [unclassified Clostridium]|jgi:lysophospholipase L1-like esterase|uniref:GDSL-type esterase/lipase family protein n=1 Tax=unclassified Clostridium TaxID=2614128 RepID=UPI0011060D20|nr:MULTISPECIES: GDSL-type esterase/lipase family protein [unclassified Clostridium]
MRRYWYSIFLTCSIVVMATANLSPDRHGSISVSQAADRTDSGPDLRMAVRETAVTETAAREISVTETADRETTALETDGISIETDFSEALFIGDSRTVGLYEYGNLGRAEVFANSGMSVFNLLNTRVSLKNGDRQNLDQVLSSGDFKTIYLMLGINELGYDIQSIVTQYRDMVDWIRGKQPGAILILEANLHVTGEKAARSSIYNNQRIDELNNAIRKIAEDTGCLYLDVNPIFDDGNGNLSAAYSTDGAHILGKYYSVWADWLRTNSAES